MNVSEREQVRMSKMGVNEHGQVRTSVNKCGWVRMSKMGVNEHGQVQVGVCERTGRRELQKSALL